MLRKTLWVLGVGAFLASSAPAAENATRWTMLNVTPRNDIADSHLIEFPDGTKVLIDAGRLGDSPGVLLAQLRARNIRSLDLAVITHFHLDHYGALLELVENGIAIKRVALNVPHPISADAEKPWGCNLDDVHLTLNKLREHSIPYFTPKIGDRLFETRTAGGAVISLDVLSVYNGFNTPIGITDVNDTSIIMRLSHGRTRALFTGDLNHAMGAYLASSNLDLRADLLKAPHHGAEGVAPNEFYDRVGATAVLVSSSRPLWRSARSMRTRNYFIERRIPVYVTGVNGSVTVTLTDQGYRVEIER